jgi:site-specific DNA recombinase
VDCVVVYKVDRLSRSLLDFARMMESFDTHQVAFVSVTQQFNTATSMGRLVLNVLLSFAQFEREIISERTRDKIAAARRKRKWAGGLPILGYDVDPVSHKLVVNEQEARRVRAIYEFYRQRQNLAWVVEELHQRGWVNKRWRTRKGHERGGKPFAKSSLHELLTRVTYVGKIRYKKEVHAGEHAAIVEEGIWQEVQELLRGHAQTKGGLLRNRFGSLLKGLLYCSACDCRMTPSHATKNGQRRYRYYVCRPLRRSPACPRSLPALALENLVLEQLRQGAGEDGATGLDCWGSLDTREQVGLFRERIQRVDFDGDSGKLSIHLHAHDQKEPLHNGSVTHDGLENEEITT